MTTSTVVDEIPLDSTTETMPSALKLEDYGDVTHHPREQTNRSRREAEEVSRGADDNDEELDSTTVESSTVSVSAEQNDSPVVGLGALTPPAISGSDHHFYYVPSPSSQPYPPSSNPSAQQVSITYPPPYTPQKDFYEFHPSHQDFTQQLSPFCNSIYRTFTPIPIPYHVWPNYHKWK
jgi:hypothetical protein